MPNLSQNEVIGLTIIVTSLVIAIILFIIFKLFIKDVGKLFVNALTSPKLECNKHIDMIYRNVKIPNQINLYNNNFDMNLAKFLIKLNILSYGITCGFNNPNNLISGAIDSTNSNQNIPVQYVTTLSGKNPDVNLDSYEPYIYIWKYGKVLLIAIRGTLSNEGWMSDIMFQQKPSKVFNNNKDILVHRGFNDLYSSMRQQLIKIVYSLYNSGEINRVVMTGHSLGASMALLAAYDISKIVGRNNIVLYTIGCPRTGNVNFAKELQKKYTHYRIQNMADIIPLVPPPYVYGNEFSHTFPVYQIRNTKTSIAHNHTPYTYLQALNEIQNRPSIINNKTTRFISHYNELDS